MEKNREIGVWGSSRFPVRHSFPWQMCARHCARPCEAGSGADTVGASVPTSLQFRGHGRKEVGGGRKPQRAAGGGPSSRGSLEEKEGKEDKWGVGVSLKCGS